MPCISVQRWLKIEDFRLFSGSRDSRKIRAIPALLPRSRLTFRLLSIARITGLDGVAKGSVFSLSGADGRLPEMAVAEGLLSMICCGFLLPQKCYCDATGGLLCCTKLVTR